MALEYGSAAIPILAATEKLDMKSLTEMTIPELIGAFEREFPTLGWIMRNDAANGYFVHLCSHNIGIAPTGTALTFQAWANTPEAAFAEAFRLCRKYHAAQRH